MNQRRPRSPNTTKIPPPPSRCRLYSLCRRWARYPAISRITPSAIAMYDERMTTIVEVTSHRWTLYFFVIERVTVLRSGTVARRVGFSLTDIALDGRVFDYRQGCRVYLFVRSIVGVPLVGIGFVCRWVHQDTDRSSQFYARKIRANEFHVSLFSGRGIGISRPELPTEANRGIAFSTPPGFSVKTARASSCSYCNWWFCGYPICSTNSGFIYPIVRQLFPSMFTQ